MMKKKLSIPQSSIKTFKAIDRDSIKETPFNPTKLD